MMPSSRAGAGAGLKTTARACTQQLSPYNPHGVSLSSSLRAVVRLQEEGPWTWL